MIIAYSTRYLNSYFNNSNSSISDEKKTISSNRENLLTALIVAISCFAITYYFFGFYFVEYEGLNISFFSGKLTPEHPFRSLYFSGNIGISYAYSLLYEEMPNIEWLSWIEYSYLFLCCFFTLFLVVSSLHSTTIVTKIIVQLLVYFSVFADSNIHLIYTRVAYMICGISLVGLVMFFSSLTLIKTRLWLFLSLNFFFTIGTLTRIEAATASLMLIVFFGICYLKDIKQCLFLFLYPILLVSSLSLLLAYDIKTAPDNEFYKQVEPDIEEQFIGRKNLVPLSLMKTNRDTVKYQMAQEMTLSDPRVMPSSYLRSLIKQEDFIFTDIHQWKRVLIDQKIMLVKYWYLVLSVVVLSVYLYWQYNFQKHKWNLFYYLIFTFSFWGLTIVQNYVDKINDRSWVPYIGLFILCHIILLIKHIESNSRFRLYITLLACSILFIINIYCLKKESNRLEGNFIFQQQQFEAIKGLSKNHYLIINSSVFDCFFLSNKPFHPFNFSAFKKIYIVDSYIIPFLPYYKRYLEEECGCDIYSYPSFWQYIRDRKDDAIIISTLERMKAIKKYLKEIHQFDLPLKPITPNQDLAIDWHAWSVGK